MPRFVICVMKNSTFSLLLSGAIIVFCAQSVWAKTVWAKTATSSTRSSVRVVHNIGDVKTVYVRKLEGDREFARRLMNEMRAMGIRFVKSSRGADALLSARGDYENDAFYGSIKFVNRNGKTLWSARATRPKGSNYMAYSRLADQLRAALQR